MNRMFQQEKCLDVAIDHGITNAPDLLIGMENIEGVMNNLFAAQPDAIQVNDGQADLRQRVAGRKPVLAMREMW